MVIVNSVSIGIGVAVIGACILGAAMFAIEISYTLWGK